MNTPINYKQEREVLIGFEQDEMCFFYKDKLIPIQNSMVNRWDVFVNSTQKLRKISWYIDTDKLLMYTQPVFANPLILKEL